MPFEVKKTENGWNFDSLFEKKELFAQIIKSFPFPLHICAPDGTMLWANDEYLKFARVTNPEKLYKKHNILQNPALERWGIKDFTQRAFRGEVMFAYDIKVPLREIVELLGDKGGEVYGSMFQNLTAFPIRGDDGKPELIVFVFTVTRHYEEKHEIVKGKEYIDENWREPFDLKRLAGAVHISKHHYTRQFKRCTGETPYGYYQRVKLCKLKERLCEKDLSVAEAFSQCGLNYNGNFAKLFKKKVGLTPSEYRRQMSSR